MKSKIIIYLAVIFLLIGCQPREKEASGPETLPVKVSKVELKDLEEAIDYAGNVRAQDEALIYPKVSGKIIQKLKEDGSPVKKGEAIAYIDRDEVGLQFQNAPIESTLDGLIGRVYVDIGANVSPQTAVALVVNADKVKVDLQVPEKYIPRIFLKQEAKISVDAYPEEEFSGEVTKMSPVVDLATRAAPIEISLDNPGHKLKSGMFAKVSLTIEKREAVAVILKEAVLGKEPDTYVYVIENKKAVLRKVILGLRQGALYEVKEGLREGEYVVIMGQQRLYEGVPVQSEE